MKRFILIALIAAAAILVGNSSMQVFANGGEDNTEVVTTPTDSIAGFAKADLEGVAAQSGLTFDEVVTKAHNGDYSYSTLEEASRKCNFNTLNCGPCWKVCDDVMCECYCTNCPH